jgi:hypothetical protein
LAEKSGLAFLQRSGGWIGLTREETKGTSQMRGGLREMRMRLPVALHGQIRVLMANRMSVRSVTPAGKATTVGLSGSVTKRAQITGPLWSTTASQRLAGQSIAKGRIDREARRG